MARPGYGAGPDPGHSTISGFSTLWRTLWATAPGLFGWLGGSALMPHGTAMMLEFQFQQLRL